MELNEYQRRASSTALPVPDHLAYNIVALAGESGELAGKLSKTLRDPGRVMDVPDTVKEIGDVLWHASETARALGYTLEDVARINLEKLSSRSMRGVITGDGDNR